MNSIKIYYKLVIGLIIIALSIDSCYHFDDRGCSDIEGLTK